jgi:hypothetical protein
MRSPSRKSDIIQAMQHPQLFGPYFHGPSWNGWATVLKAAYALPMSDSERAFFRTIAERDPPKKAVRERIWIAGRGAGKDSIESLDTTFSAVTFDRQDKLRPGERAVVMCLAVDREQAQIILGYVKGYFAKIPALRKMVMREAADGLELNNGVDIIIATNSYRSIRGRSFLHVCMDEAAFFKDEFSSSPDLEVYNACKPGLRLPGSTLTIISTPYRRAGLLYNKYAKHYGRDDDDVLVIKAPSLVLNPTLDQSIIDQALADDPSANAAGMASRMEGRSQFLHPAAADRGGDRCRRERAAVRQAIPLHQLHRRFVWSAGLVHLRRHAQGDGRRCDPRLPG